MINTILSTRIKQNYNPHKERSQLTNSLIESRNLFSVQTIEYDLNTVCSTDLDPSGNFLLVGQSNGAVDLQEIRDTQYGILDHLSRFHFSQNNLHRVQWNPGHEQFFSTLDNHNLCLIDPVEMRLIEKFDFNLKANWSEWHPNDGKIIAVCGSESQVRLADIRSGSSVQTIILGANSGLSSHRATRCLWSGLDESCLVVGDNEGFIHVYDTRQSIRPYVMVGEERGQISGMSFTHDQRSVITSQGTENHLVQWSWRNCSLKADPFKFKKREKIQSPTAVDAEFSACDKTDSTTASGSKNVKKDRRGVSVLPRKYGRRVVPLSVDAYLRCQFYVSDRHVYCPVPNRIRKSKEIYIYDLENGIRIKTIKSEDILRQGVFSVTGLLPESLVIYVGGRGRLRVWTIDEDYQRKMEEKMNEFHQSRWDSEEEL